MTKNPITRNTFRYCRVRFCWTTFLETAVYTLSVPAQHPLVTTTLIILGSITIKTPFPSLGLKFGTAFPKAIEVYQSTYSKRKSKHYYL